MSLVYCFDLDGTLCTTVSSGDYEKAQPLYDRIEEVNKLYDAGHDIIIDTARNIVLILLLKRLIGMNKLTKYQLDVWGVKHHKLRVGTKIAADHYIDDKGENADNFYKN